MTEKQFKKKTAIVNALIVAGTCLLITVIMAALMVSTARAATINFQDEVTAVNLIKDAESFMPTPYLDTKGHWTIGYGFLCHDAICTASMSKKQANAYLIEILPRYEQIARDYWGVKWQMLTDNQRAVSIDMAYNLGNRLNKFKKLKSTISSMEIENSLYCKDVGSRCKRNVKLWDK